MDLSVKVKELRNEATKLMKEKLPPIFMRVIRMYRSVRDKLKNIVGGDLSQKATENMKIFVTTRKPFHKITNILDCKRRRTFSSIEEEDEENLSVAIQCVLPQIAAVELAEELSFLGFNSVQLFSGEEKDKAPFDVYLVELNKGERPQTLYQLECLLHLKVKTDKTEQGVIQCFLSQLNDNQGYYIKGGDDHPSSNCQGTSKERIFYCSCAEDDLSVCLGYKLLTKPRAAKHRRGRKSKVSEANRRCYSKCGKERRSS